MCYVLLFYNQYIYGELSIFLLFILSLDTPDEVIYYHFCHLSDLIIFYQYLSQISNMCCLLISVTIFWGNQSIPYLLYWDYEANNHTSFYICWSSGNIKHMFMSIKNPISTTLIIYSSKKLSIFNFTHHLFFQNTFNLSSRCKQVNTRIEAYSKINILPFYFTENPNKIVQPIALQKYRLYIGVDLILV